MSRINCENENNNNDIKNFPGLLFNFKHEPLWLEFPVFITYRPGKFTDNKTNDSLMREGIPLDALN